MELELLDADCEKLLSGCPAIRKLKVRLSDPVRNKWFGSHTICMPRSLKHLTFEELRQLGPACAELELEHDVDWVAELLKALCRTKLLTLKHYTTHCLFQAPALELPEFRCLLNLELDVLSFNSNFVMNLLHNCHVLQVFAIHNRKYRYMNWVEYPGPAPPTGVPICVTSHLKIFKFGEYEELQMNVHLLNILKRGPVLETAAIHPIYSQEVICHARGL
ncbi:hypothetical protein PIB30_079088 [Stylosanthes scabra]|uniref:FBD domain-containing protein n=1 Tax=Stylosanthes scabra TaxID=79078 RepID=A0ABU6WPB7_9FABA|nr:hypothetical protein [Stylosanthes scabra]